MDAAEHLENAREIADVAVVDPELARVGTAFVLNGGGFEPDQLGAAPGEAFVPAPSQFAGTAVESPIAAFHRMDADGVPDRDAADLHGPPERFLDARSVGLEANVL